MFVKFIVSFAIAILITSASYLATPTAFMERFEVVANGKQIVPTRCRQEMRMVKFVNMN